MWVEHVVRIDLAYTQCGFRFIERADPIRWLRPQRSVPVTFLECQPEQTLKRWRQSVDRYGYRRRPHESRRPTEHEQPLFDRVAGLRRIARALILAAERMSSLVQ
jgi:hypothetical protein